MCEIELNKQLVLIDSLTGAYNRKAFDSNINEALMLFKRYQTPFSLLILDVDDFKYINDNYGHIMGDNILKDLVVFAKENIRATDKLFRIGGDEFVVLCENTLLSDAVHIAEKLRDSIEKLLFHKYNIKVTLSIGVSQVKEADTEESIYKRADENLYNSKREGKNK